MANGAPPPTSPAGKKAHSRRNLMIVGFGAVVVIFLIVRSRQSAAGGTDPQQSAAEAAMQAAQNQQAADQAAGMGPSTFADNGAQAGALGDAVTSGLSGITQSFNDLSQQLAQQQQAASTTGTSPATTITINNGPGANHPGQPQKGNGKGKTGRPALPKIKGAMYGPFGHYKPKPRRGYHIKGLGGGYWAYLPNRR